MDKPLVGPNLIAGPTVSSPQKNVTLDSLINSLPQPQPLVSSSTSWTHDSTFTHQREQPITQAKKIDRWDDSSTTQSDDDDTGVYRTNVPPPTFPKPQPLNGTAMFTTTPTKDDSDDSKSDEDSIEAAVQKLNTQKAAAGIENLVNKQIGNTYKLPQQISIPNVQSPLSEDSSWTASSSTLNKESTTKVVHPLVLQPPLLSKKSTEPSWDDSRPLSADLKRSTNISNNQDLTSSDESDADEDKKQSTIVKSPFTNSAISDLVSKNIQSTQFSDSETTGVENLTKIIETIMFSSAATQKQ